MPKKIASPSDETLEEFTKLLNSLDRDESDPEAPAPSEVTPDGLALDLALAADALNEQLKGAQQDLIALNLGAEASVDLPLEPGDYDNDVQRKLALRKTPQGWKLMVELWHEGDDEPAEETELLEAGRESRTAAAAILHELVAALVKTSQDRLERMRAAVANVEVVRKHITRRGKQ